jgi:orotate phosphoribosyltransferase
MAKDVQHKAGAVIWQELPGAEPLVLLVSARKQPHTWVFPVGSVESGESLEQAAARECQEESGYRVAIRTQLATIARDSLCFTFYLAQVQGECTEWEQDRQRRWVPLTQALPLLPEIFQSLVPAAIKTLRPTKEQERQGLKDLLLSKSYRQGSFTLTSGATSDFYIDGKQSTLDAEGSYLCGRLLLDLIHAAPQAIGGVGGMTLGADPLVTAVSLVSHLSGQPIPAFIVRKEAKGHGTGNFLEGKKNLQPGCAVALVEDVVTTGGTLLKVIERVEQEGFTVALVATLVDREEGGAEVLAQAGYPLQALFTRTELMA